MPVPYVTFPGVAGNYVASSDVNLLDADTAHLQQSIGGWVSRVTAANFQLDTDLTPKFGDSELSFTRSTGAVTVAAKSAIGLDGAPVAASTVYTGLAFVASQTVDATSEMKLTWFDASGAQLTTSPAGAVPSIGGTAWIALSVTATSPATAAFCSIEIINRSAAGFEAGEKQYVDAVCLRQGDSTVFVPSIGVVGDVEFSVKAAATNWTTPSDQSPLAHHSTASQGAGFYLLSRPTGGFRVYYSLDGTTTPNVVFAVPAPVPQPGAVVTARFTRIASTGLWTEYREDVETDTQAGTAGALFASTADVTIGRYRSNHTGLEFDGNIYWAEIRDGIDGPIVARFDAEDIPT